MKYIAWFVLSIIVAGAYMAMVVEVGRGADRLIDKTRAKWRQTETGKTDAR